MFLKCCLICPIWWTNCHIMCWRDWTNFMCLSLFGQALGCWLWWSITIECLISGALVGLLVVEMNNHGMHHFQEHRRGRDLTEEEEEEQKSDIIFDIKHTAVQHRQYLEFEVWIHAVSFPLSCLGIFVVAVSISIETRTLILYNISIDFTEFGYHAG